MQTPSLLFRVSLGMLLASPSLAHNLNKKDKVFFIDTPWVERAWSEGDIRVGLDVSDVPGPTGTQPATAILLRLPGVRLNLYDRLELGVDLPFVFNPDAQSGEIPVADPAKAAAGEVASADFDLPSANVYAKFALIEDKRASKQAAIGVEGKLGLSNNPGAKAFDSLTSLRSPLMSPYEFQVRPFVAGAIASGNWAPQGSLGVTVAKDNDLPGGLTDAAGNAVPGLDVWLDWAVAAPIYIPFNEVAVVVGATGRHLLSGLSTALDDRVAANAGFMFGGSSPAEFGFVVQVPVLSATYRESFETVSFQGVYSYNFERLTLRKRATGAAPAAPEEKPTNPSSSPTSAPVLR